MADNIDVTPGSGKTIATDDVSGTHYQKIKLYDATDAGTNAAIVSAAGSLHVNLAEGSAAITGTVDAVVTPDTTGGLSIFRSLDLDETEEEVKGTAGQLYGYYFYNAATSVRYLKFYNATAASVTVGSTTPVLTLPLPASSAGHVEFTNGIAFGTAMSAAATTGLADANTGAPGADEVIVNVFFK